MQFTLCGSQELQYNFINFMFLSRSAVKAQTTLIVSGL